MVGARAKERPRRRSSEAFGITAHSIDRLWGASKATGAGRLGMTARLSHRRADGRTEISRPACKHTHAISVWIDGSTHSSLRLNGKTRFSQMRTPGTFQIARAGESVDVIMNDRSGKCLDLYLPDTLLKGALERDFDKTSSGLELLEVGVERDAEINRLARDILRELESPALSASVAIDAAHARAVRHAHKAVVQPVERRGGAKTEPRRLEGSPRVGPFESVSGREPDPDGARGKRRAFALPFSPRVQGVRGGDPS